MLSKSFILVKLVFRHRLITVSDTQIRAGKAAFPLIKSRAVIHIHSRYFCGDESLSVLDRYSQNRTDRRAHLFTLIFNLLLQVLGIIYAGFTEIGALVNTKYNRAACVLVGKTGKRIAETLWTAMFRRFNLQRLRLALHALNPV